jgi:hypothetical protein
MIDDVTVLVVGFDQWAVMWLGFCHFWHKFWPDCPWPLAFMSNTRTAPCGETLLCGTDTNWTTMMVHALRQVKTNRLLLMLADYWLAYPVDVGAVSQFAGYLDQYGAQHIRLQRSDPVAQQSIGPFEPDPRLFVFAPYASYRISLQAALWDKSTLVRLLRGRENPWEFETRASYRSANWVNALCVDLTTTPDQWNGCAYFAYHNIVSMGQWCGKPVNDALEPDVRAFIERYG